MLTARLTCRGIEMATRSITCPDRQSGRSSGVEHNLAKVGVEGSNPFARSSFLPENQRFRRPATLEILETMPRRDPHCLHIVSNFGTGWGVVGKAGRSS